MYIHVSIYSQLGFWTSQLNGKNKKHACAKHRLEKDLNQKDESKIWSPWKTTDGLAGKSPHSLMKFMPTSHWYWSPHYHQFFWNHHLPSSIVTTFCNVLFMICHSKYQKTCLVLWVNIWRPLSAYVLCVNGAAAILVKGIEGLATSAHQPALPAKESWYCCLTRKKHFHTQT